MSTHPTTHNPLDTLEIILHENQWSFDRFSSTEMMVDIAGRWGKYQLYFIWQEDSSAMQFSCHLDLPIKEPMVSNPKHFKLLYAINARLWLGHFDICPDQHKPAFRQTTLLRGARSASMEQLEDLVEIALSECDRYFPTFQLVLSEKVSVEDALSMSICDTMGEA